jgi:L-arabinose isomerase
MSTSPRLWFVTGSQHLYGPAALQQVAANAQAVAAGLDRSGKLPLPLIATPVMTTADEIRALCRRADADPDCAGLVLWMHTFSPAKMWIGGMAGLRKPFAHLHTQAHRELPWGSIDMDFMNLHQAAHGDREGAYLHTRMRQERAVVVGFWQDAATQDRLAVWARAALAWHDLQGARIARFGDNMRNVAVTDGDKVAAEIRFGVSVLAFAAHDLAERARAVPDAAASALAATYAATYRTAPELMPGGARHAHLVTEARTEIALRGFLKDERCVGFTSNFEDLAHLPQLPGLAVQRLMADGFGFGAEGDWKTCFLLRALKTMGRGLPGGTSWMEDYTYHLAEGRELVLGAHMLEVCPSIAAATPTLEVHPLGIGGKADPARLVFDAAAGPAVNASLVDLGNRFRLIGAEVDIVPPPAALPHLPVARAVWSCRPDFRTSTSAWLYAGGAHHAACSQAVGLEHLEDFAAIAGIELVRIERSTDLVRLRQDLRLADAAYALAQGLGRV